MPQKEARHEHKMLCFFTRGTIEFSATTCYQQLEEEIKYILSIIGRGTRFCAIREASKILSRGKTANRIHKTKTYCSFEMQNAAGVT